MVSLTSSLIGPQILLSILALSFAYLASVVIYRIYFHPLAKIPGPFLGKFTEWYLYKSIVQQDRTYMQHAFVRKYGSPVRIATDELVFADEKSWTDIYAQSSNPCLKSPFYDALTLTGERNLLNAVHRPQHARIRRLLSYSFALQTILKSQGMIANRVDIFVDYVFGNAARKGAVVDIYNSIHEHYLDIVSELCFGYSFECLREEGSQRFHDVDNFLNVVPPKAFFPAIKYLPVAWLQEGFRGLERLEKFSRSAVEEFTKMVEKDDETLGKTNFLRNLVTAVDEETGSKLSTDEIVENAVIFLVAGSGTTAVTTTYTIWECGRNPEAHAKLVKEIRTAFPDRDVMPTWDEVCKLVSSCLLLVSQAWDVDIV
jgi:cytochrome P450